MAKCSFQKSGPVFHKSRKSPGTTDTHGPRVVRECEPRLSSGRVGVEDNDDNKGDDNAKDDRDVKGGT